MWVLRRNEYGLHDLEREPADGRAPRLAGAPEEWLENELTRLRRTLLDAHRRCQPHAVAPDGATYFDPRKPWDQRNWAVFQRLSKSSRIALLARNVTVVGEWQLVRTVSRAERPDGGHWQRVLPVQRTIVAAETGARKRAAKARRKLDEANHTRRLIQELLDLDRSEWPQLASYLPPGMPSTKVRKVMLALLVQHQGGHCPLCGQTLFQPVLDHDHTTDLVRGALCPGCNSKEGGAFTWTPELEPRLAVYRGNPPAAPFGWTYGQRPTRP